MSGVAASGTRVLVPRVARQLEGFTPYPSPLYKYLKREFAEKLLALGTVRLGTLRDYQDEERLGAAIGDGGEGSATLYDNTPHIITGSTEPGGGPYRQLIGRMAPGNEFIGCVFEAPRLAPNSWLYCVSARPSHRLLAEFEADICVIITSPQAFFRAIGTEVGRRSGAVEMMVATCDYTGRLQSYSERGEILPEFLKAPRYANQQEVRGIYRPQAPDIEPFVMDVPSLREFCQVLEALPE